MSEAHGPDPLSALTNGFQSAFATAVVFAVLGLAAAVVAFGKVRTPPLSALSAAASHPSPR